MKGIVFTEFMDMVASKFSENMVDDIIDDAQPASGGAYTAVGTYPHQEMVQLVMALSARTGLPVAQLLREFGLYLFASFAKSYGMFFTGVKDAFHFLSGIEDVIHAEVLKLYPDAELPRFVVEKHTEQELIIRYSSVRHLEDLAEGLIQGCITYFGESILLQRESVGDGAGRSERFRLTRMQHS